MKTFSVTLLFTASLLFPLSCASTKYLVSRTHVVSPSSQRNSLLVFLPGRESRFDSFERDGLLDVLKESGVDADCVSADATFAYYMDRSLIDRLDADVFAKAENTNYRHYWFIGNSMGTIGALLYVKRHPGRIRGLILIGPYLGEGPVISDIQAAGGLKKWRPKLPPWQDYVTDIWTELKEIVTDKSGKKPAVFLLTGTGDRYRKTQELLSKELPENHVFWAEGGHDWGPWNRAFRDFLNSDTAGKMFSGRSGQAVLPAEKRP